MDGAKKSGIVPLDIPKSPNSGGNVGIRPGLMPGGKAVSQGDSATPKSGISKLTAEAAPPRSDVKASASKTLTAPDDQRIYKDYIVFRRLAASPLNALCNKADAIVKAANQLGEQIAKSGKPDQISAQLGTLQGSLGEMVETFLNDGANEMRVSLPKELEGAIRQAWIAVTDAKRRGDKAGGPEKRAEALGLVAGATKAIKAYVAEAVEEETLQTRYRHQRGQEDLKSILQDPKQIDRLALLRASCKAEFAEENLDFLLAVQRASQTPEAGQPAAYQKITSDFVAKGAGSKQVNVSGSLQQNTVTAAHRLYEAADAGALTAVKSQMDACYDQVFNMVLHGAYRAKGGKLGAGG